MIDYSKQLRILLIDDEEETQVLFKKFLENRGYFVLMASDGEEGLKVLSESHVDIVFCDVVMPNMDGITFLKRAEILGIKTQIIMMTGSPSVETNVEVVGSMACDYLIKPVDRKDILKSIDRAKRNIEEKRSMVVKGLHNRPYEGKAII